MIVKFAGHTLDKQRHLFILLQQAAMQAIRQRFFAHGTGIHRFDRFDQLGEPLLRSALIRAKDAFIFARERIAVSIFQ